MKEKIHPNYGKAVVRCICGETFETGSVKKELRVDICSKCHPFYTGKQKLVDRRTCGSLQEALRHVGNSKHRLSLSWPVLLPFECA